MSLIILSFLLCLVGFVLVGVASTIRSRQTNSDYLLAGSSVKPWLSALSAIATTNSGYMFIGMIGYTYWMGISSVWLAVGWILGDLVMSFIVHPKLRSATEASRSLSFSEVLGRWGGRNFDKVRLFAGVLTVFFLGVYAAAQLKAGSKALHVLFEWNISTGAIIGAVMVVLYCFSGGIRASIWTDAAQSFVMFASMVVMFGVGIAYMGGISATIQALDAVSQTYLNIFPTNLKFGAVLGPILFIASWIFGGFAVVGQPHVMVRFMALSDVKYMKRVRWYYYGWYIGFYALTIGVGLLARLILPETSMFDAELALPTVSMELLPDIWVGLVLAGLFAATMSTADSQILACTAAITRDLRPHKETPMFVTKFVTIFVTFFALLLALFAPGSVFELVLVAWSGLASAFGPLLIIYAFKGRISQNHALLVMTSGLIAAVAWRFAGLSGAVYEVMPGMLAGGLIYLLGRPFFNRKHN